MAFLFSCNTLFAMFHSEMLEKGSQALYQSYEILGMTVWVVYRGHTASRHSEKS